MIYLDNSATTKPFESVAEVVAREMTEGYYNISSPYASALSVEKKLNADIKDIAHFFNAKPEELIFTSGGSESDNTALMCAPPNSEVIVSATEHHAILNCERPLAARNIKTVICPVNKAGVVEAEALLSLINEKTSLVSIMHVNNETGAINDIKSLCEAVKARNKSILFHSDGVQSFMHVNTDMREQNVDMYSVSGHKVHGPKGIGVLYVKQGTPFVPFIYGGGQQKNLRSGTVNTPGIMGLAEALRTLGDGFAEHLNEIKSAYIERLMLIDGAHLNCESSAPNILSIAFEGVKASSLQNALEQEVIIGKGSACTSRSSKVSHVLDAMNIPMNIAEATVRLSFGAFNTVAEADVAAECIKAKITYLRKYKRR